MNWGFLSAFPESLSTLLSPPLPVAFEGTSLLPFSIAFSSIYPVFLVSDAVDVNFALYRFRTKVRRLLFETEFEAYEVNFHSK